MNQKNNPKVVKAWKMYDWAYQVHSLVIASAIFPIYYGAVTFSGTENSISFMGFQPEAAFSFASAVGFLMVVLLTPVLSAVADTMGNKKQFLKLFAYLGAISCIAMFFFIDDRIGLGLVLYATSSIGFWGSRVFYDGYLAEIVTKDKMDKTSADGFIYGYIGSVILMLFCLFLIQYVGKGNEAYYTRISFVLTGVWWLGFAQISFRRLPLSVTNESVSTDIIKNSFSGLWSTAKELHRHKSLRVFLSSFFFLSLGMQTIFLMAALFGRAEIGLNADKLIITILLIQLEAIIGARLFAFLSEKIGNKNTLLFGIFIWIIVCFIGYSTRKGMPHVELQFYIMAGLVGLVMGGIQPLARSTFAKLLPPTEHLTTYFSFYAILEKVALCLGLLIFGVAIQMTSGMQVSTLAMGVSFFVSLVIMYFLKTINTVYK
ncbi:MAG: MFS transporter [Chitinophagales bacterium]|nr:MFS transporter [Chitinophagales bacterium]